MELIPAIDLLGGHVVRLSQGRYDAVKSYGADPVELARAYADAGARRLHVVDLDGARDGRAAHRGTVERMLEATSLAVQVGGGVRDAAIAEAWFSAGVARVVLGTAAVRDPDFARELCGSHPEGVVIAADAKDGVVAVEGWRKSSGRELLDFAREVDAWGAAAVLYTDIARDGMKGGPDAEGTARLQRELRATVIASGGVSCLDDLLRLKQAGVRAAVSGRALLDGDLVLEEALRLMEQS
ncbi:MAG: 1-(5-phosphoribosyl)-5-[(5-phosphoribosylamino)methylideneamino]imidazole-4-carboxamide isomerase [Deltaproteobacteria bacterium]|nr:1-(5-phosphoribosyl)-5-[(5-phosphoribosylamino)methylideneamino]imidazole-4-carboxamide isomerase [Deltaproteobacteria bacterium]